MPADYHVTLPSGESQSGYILPGNRTALKIEMGHEAISDIVIVMGCDEDDSSTDLFWCEMPEVDNDDDFSKEDLDGLCVKDNLLENIRHADVYSVKLGESETDPRPFSLLTRHFFVLGRN